MIFQSFNFLLLFLPLALTAYYVSKNNGFRNIILIIISFIFYAWGNWWWALILISSAVVDFTLAQKINLLNQRLLISDNKQEIDILAINRKRKIILITSIVFNISLLAFFKYWDWLIGLIEDGLFIDLTFLKHYLPLPVAISFYTFESLSYIIDVYRKQFKPTKNFLDYLTFIAFFPKLVAGPIMRAHELLPQLTKLRKRPSYRNIEMAIFLISWGLFKKLVFADNLGHLVDRCRENINNAGVGLILAIAFSYQIYCDFSAYCDIARGVAKLFSIRLGRNFLTPYFATNASDFFKRWNISLSSWIRDYVYLPICGNRRNKMVNLFAVIFTMLLFGVWHGAGFSFVLYGFYCGLMIIFYRFIPLDKIIIKIFGNKLGLIIAIFIGFWQIAFGMLIFCSKSFIDFSKSMESIFAIADIVKSNYLMSEPLKILIYGLLIYSLPIIVTDIIGYKRNREFVDLYPKIKFVNKIFIYLIMIYGTLFFASRGSYEFIYFQF